MFRRFTRNKIICPSLLLTVSKTGIFEDKNKPSNSMQQAVADDVSNYKLHILRNTLYHSAFVFMMECVRSKSVSFSGRVTAEKNHNFKKNEMFV